MLEMIQGLKELKHHASLFQVPSEVLTSMLHTSSMPLARDRYLRPASNGNTAVKQEALITIQVSDMFFPGLADNPQEMKHVVLMKSVS